MEFVILNLLTVIGETKSTYKKTSAIIIISMSVYEY